MSLPWCSNCSYIDYQGEEDCKRQKISNLELDSTNQSMDVQIGLRVVVYAVQLLMLCLSIYMFTVYYSGQFPEQTRVLPTYSFCYKPTRLSSALVLRRCASDDPCQIYVASIKQFTNYPPRTAPQKLYFRPYDLAIGLETSVWCRGNHVFVPCDRFMGQRGAFNRSEPNISDSALKDGMTLMQRALSYGSWT